MSVESVESQKTHMLTSFFSSPLYITEYKSPIITEYKNSHVEKKASNKLIAYVLVGYHYENPIPSSWG